MSWNGRTRIVLVCGRGCGGALRGELKTLGFSGRESSPTTVETWGTLRDAMRMNLWVRTATRVLYELASFEADSADDFYAAVRALPWEEWLRLDAPFHVHGTALHKSIRDPRFAVLRCKDAVADRLVERTGARPDSSSRAEGAAGVSFFWQGRKARLFLDTSGVSLSNRGYRWRPWVAPLRETLAAAILLELGWPKTPAEAFAGPMCGSGTLAIEAAWLAQRRAPGLERRDFAFLHLKGAPLKEWRELQAEARGRFRAAPRTWLAASDIAADAVACARDNASRAGVEHLIRFAVGDFRETALPRPPGLVVVNPGYGGRVGQEEQLAEQYRALGAWFKRECEGLRVAVFTGNPALGRQIGLRATRQTPIWNGNVACRLQEYEMYAGTRDTRLLRKHAGEQSRRE